MDVVLEDLSDPGAQVPVNTWVSASEVGGVSMADIAAVPSRYPETEGWSSARLRVTVDGEHGSTAVVHLDGAGASGESLPRPDDSGYVSRAVTLQDADGNRYRQWQIVTFVGPDGEVAPPASWRCSSPPARSWSRGAAEHPVCVLGERPGTRCGAPRPRALRGLDSRLEKAGFRTP